MARIIWSELGTKTYETGVKQGVLYPTDDKGAYSLGVAWNGLIGVSESPSGAEPTPLYADDTKYLTLVSTEEYGATIEAYTYPDEFSSCDGSAELSTGIIIGQQNRKAFGLCYRTTIGNDTNGIDFGYKIHLVYGCTAAPSEKGYKSINNSPEAITFSWTVTTTPVPVTGFKPTASLRISSTKVDSAKLKELEDILYGTSEVEPRLPLPDEIITLMSTQG